MPRTRLSGAKSTATTTKTSFSWTSKRYDLSLTLDEQMWGSASNWGGGLNLPSFLVRIGTTVERLPRMVQLTGDR